MRSSNTRASKDATSDCMRKGRKRERGIGGFKGGKGAHIGVISDMSLL